MQIDASMFKDRTLNSQSAAISTGNNFPPHGLVKGSESLKESSSIPLLKLALAPLLFLLKITFILAYFILGFYINFFNES